MLCIVELKLISAFNVAWRRATSAGAIDVGLVMIPGQKEVDVFHLATASAFVWNSSQRYMRFGIEPTRIFALGRPLSRVVMAASKLVANAEVLVGPLHASLAPIKMVTNSAWNLTAFFACSFKLATLAPLTDTFCAFACLLFALMRRNTLSTALFVPVDHEFAGQLVSGIEQVSKAWVIESPRADTLFGYAADAPAANTTITAAASSDAASTTRMRVTGSLLSRRGSPMVRQVATVATKRLGRIVQWRVYNPISLNTPPRRCPASTVVAVRGAW